MRRFSLVYLATTLLAQASCGRLPTALRIRGGDAADDEDKEKNLRAEVINKLNQCPTFCVVNGEGNVVGIPNGKGTNGFDVTWFTDIDEAKELLMLMQASGDDEAPELKLGCTPLGNAFMICAGWSEHKSEEGGAEYKMQASRSVLGAEAEATLRAQLLQRGVEDESIERWLLPVFMHDDFQTDTMMPVFFSADALTKGWITNGRPVEDAPEQPLMMDIRMLVLAMRQDSGMRAKAQLVPSEEAYKIAKQIHEQGEA